MTFRTVANVSGSASTAMRMPIPSDGQSDRQKERREHDERAARNSRRGEREKHRREGHSRQLRRVQRNSVEPSDEQRAHRPRYRRGDLEERHGERQRESSDPIRNVEALLGALDQRRQRGDRRARAERDQLSRKRRSREASKRDPPDDHGHGIQQERHCHARHRIRRDVQADRAGNARSKMRRERQHEREDADRRQRHDPTHEHEHRRAKRLEERRKRLARRRRNTQDRQRQENRKDDQRDHVAVRRCGDGVRWNERREPPTERLSLRSRKLARRFSRADWQRGMCAAA